MKTQNARKPAWIKEPQATDTPKTTAQNGTTPRSKSTKQVPNTRQRGVGKNSVNYWLARIAKPKNSRGEESPHFGMQLKFRGRRLYFSLGTSNRNAAAARAAAIYGDLLAVGAEATLAKHRPDTAAPEQSATVGEWIAAARAVSETNPSTFAFYARSLRKIVGDILAVKRTKARFGPRRGGAAAYRATIDAASLDILTAAAVQQWRLNYVRTASNPAEERSRMTTANSTIRQARSLFAEKVCRFISDCRLPDPPPFHRVEFFPRQSAKYFSRIDAKELLQKAHRELSEANPPAFVTMLLALSAGLRRGEIDGLTWGQVDFDRQLLRVEPTAQASLKTTDSRAEVPIDEHVASVLRGFYAKAGGKPSGFVIKGAGSDGGQTKWGQHYRADSVFTYLTDWLRKNGVTAKKPLHELRKELGALVTAEHGIYAASRVLRHADVSTTARHYTDLKTRPVVNIGQWLVEPENIVPMTSPSKKKKTSPRSSKRAGGDK